MNSLFKYLNYYFESRHTLLKQHVDLQQRYQLALIEARIRQLDSSSSLSQDTSQLFSWKDEWFTFLFSLPLFLCFFPGFSDYVSAGFEALSSIPVWYQYCVAFVLASAFGYKKLLKLLTIKRSL